MSKNRRSLFFLLGLLILCLGGAWQLSAVEGDVQSGYLDIFLNNPYLLENIRLIQLAEESYDAGRYDDAVMYAAQAATYAQLSDNFVDRFREVDEAIYRAQTLLNAARTAGADRRFADTYNSAERTLSDALNYRSTENFDDARSAALRAIAMLESLPREAPLPAQYLVRTWAEWRDCLWNIAGKPEIYNDPTLWRHIYEANRSKMPDPGNPDLIHPGMILDIPSIRGEFRQGLMEGD